MEAKTVAKTLADMEPKALVDTLPNTLSEVVGKKIAYTLTCLKAEARPRLKQKLRLMQELRLTQLSIH